MADPGVYSRAMMMTRHGAVVVKTHRTRKRRPQGQEREKADEDAAPLHDPEQGSQHLVLNTCVYRIAKDAYTRTVSF